MPSRLNSPTATVVRSRKGPTRGQLIVPGRLEASVAPTQQHPDRVRTRDNCYILEAVAVELTGHKGLGTPCGGTDMHFSKPTLPVAEKDRDLAGRMAHRQICTSIAVEVAYGDTSMVFAAQGGSSASEAPIPVVQQDRYTGFCKPIPTARSGKTSLLK